MEKEIKELLILLDILIAHHRELLSVEQKKMNAVINQNWYELEKLLNHSRLILKDIDKAEKIRLDLVEKITGFKETSLSQLKEKISTSNRKKLVKSGELLKKVMEEIKELNARVENLLQSSLEIIDFSISLFSGSDSKTYSGTGREKKDEGKHTSLIFDIKA